VTRRPSPAEPVTELRRVRILECGEEIVDFMTVCPNLLLDVPRFRYRRETLLRRRVAEMLCEANRRLPPGYRLAIIEGWRPPYIQKRMYRFVWNRFADEHRDWSHARLTRTVNRYTAPMNARVPPPHTTGAAVDLMLADEQGRIQDHNSPYDAFDPSGFSLDAPGLSDRARRTRDILAEAISGTGLTNYPSEYWHWSHGDQGWAYRGGHAHAIFGSVQPEGWVPAPEDVTDEPLELLERQAERDIGI
jgi:zinc D-Ala-D-Ala dipeptidase